MRSELLDDPNRIVYKALAAGIPRSLGLVHFLHNLVALNDLLPGQHTELIKDGLLAELPMHLVVSCAHIHRAVCHLLLTKVQTLYWREIGVI